MAKKWKIFEKVEMFKEGSWFNRLLLKYFNRRIIYHKSVFYNQVQKVNYTCNLCKESVYKLPNICGEKYVYKLEDPYRLQIQDIEPDHKDINVYGWIVEYRYPNYPDSDNWYHHWNRKIYKTQKEALDSVNQLRNDYVCWRSNRWNSKWGEVQIRITPMYNIRLNLYRDITLNKLLN